MRFFVFFWSGGRDCLLDDTWRHGFFKFTMASFWCLHCYLWTYFTPFSSISRVNFDFVIADLEYYSINSHDWIIPLAFIIYENWLATSKDTAWKVPEYLVSSGSYFPVFGLNTEIRPEKTPYSDSFHAVEVTLNK